MSNTVVQCFIFPAIEKHDHMEKKIYRTKTLYIYKNIINLLSCFLLTDYDFNTIYKSKGL